MRQKTKLIPFFFLFILLLFPSIAYAQQPQLSGVVLDKASGEPIIGAAVLVNGTTIGTTTDFDGNFALSNIPDGVYSVSIRYISYITLEMDSIKISSATSLNFELKLEEDNYKLSEVVIVAQAKTNTEVSMLKAQKASLTVASTVSAQQIAKSQDRDASEVIRRIPGISLIDGKFVMVRGLSQRFNNVWINNAAVASSEADSRAFSFDIIPSSQLDNMVIVKTPIPELPADFAGGFIQIATKDVPEENSFDISIGTSVNTQTHFSPFYASNSSSTDFLGFNSSARTMPGTMSDRLNNLDLNERSNATLNSFNNNLSVHSFKPIGDLRFSTSYAHKFNFKNSQSLGLIASLNYTNSYNTKTNMENNRFGVYDIVSDESVYTHHYNDNVYSNNVRLGALLNLTYVINPENKIQFKNIFNQLGNAQYRTRTGYQDVSSRYEQEMYEYLYQSRSTYNGQVAGAHTMSAHKLDWSLGFAYSNRMQPDRIMINREQDDITPGYMGLMSINQNDIQREFSTLNEYIYSGAVNYKTELSKELFTATLKAGLYGEYRTRKFEQRSFYYAFDESNLPDDFRFYDVVNQMFQEEYLGADKLYVYERTDNTNSYSAHNSLLAGYLAANLQYGPFNGYVGVRAEYNNRVIEAYTHQNEFYTKTYSAPSFNLFPSLNMTYKINEKNQLRAGYGSSVNRPEFREVSTFSYYDFDRFSTIVGNPDLKETYIQNVDLRYEWYPSAAELISAGIFYKHFTNPIEFTYVDAGGTYNYTFENAEKANSYGIEVEIRKDLSFIGLKDFSVNLNMAYIMSRVQFDDSSLNSTRAMQGQSPYLINAALFYQNDKIGFSGSLLYNCIGKRLIEVGRSSVSGISNNDIPDTYEMPRHSLDLNLTQKLPKGFEIKLSAKDLICNPVMYVQNLQLEDSEGNSFERNQIVRSYNPGRTFYLSLSYKL